MKKLLALFTSLMLCVGTVSQAKNVVVTVATPGSLRTLVAGKHVTSLTVVGNIGDSDVACLKQLCRRLKSLDLSRASFGGSGMLPAGLFRGCKLSRIVLPADVTLPDSAFHSSLNLQEVVFPRHASGIWPAAFFNCPKLNRLVIHDVDLIAYHAFTSIPRLESIVIDGVLGHVDGWFCSQLPKLKSIVFAGYIISTGGQPIADDCPELETVEFSGIALPMYFGSVDNCPKLKRCTVTGVVLGSSDSTFIPRVIDKKRIDERLLEPLVSYLKRQETTASSKGLLPSSYYNLACSFALIGSKSRAMAMLRKAIDCGYSNGAWISKDPDLVSLHGDALFAQLTDSLKRENDYLYVLKQAPGYQSGTMADGPRFTYDTATCASLAAVRDFFNLDSILGAGQEIDRLKRLMYFVHNAIRHNGSGGFPKGVERNSIALYKATAGGKGTLNCRGLAVVLSELYMAAGWPARMLTCLPRKYKTDADCHVITVVWSRTLGKWVWMDPTFAAYVTDDAGQLLGPQQVRQYMRQGKPWHLNSDANWNNESQESHDMYENYMAKNLYFLMSTLHNGFQSDNSQSVYYTLSPAGTDYDGSTNVDDDTWFWQAPE